LSGRGPTAPRALARIAAAAVVLSTLLYVSFFAAIGDPLNMLGEPHGKWETLGPYYMPVLAIAAACLAFALPELSPVTAMVFGVTQVIACVVCCTLTARSGHEWWANAMAPLALVMLPLQVAYWVVPGAVVGACLRLGARAIAKRGR
jgi:hypothetical protein